MAVHRHPVASETATNEKDKDMKPTYRRLQAIVPIVLSHAPGLSRFEAAEVAAQIIRASETMEDAKARASSPYRLFGQPTW